MTRIMDALREAVRKRAVRRCEYRRLPDRLHVGGFEVDHIIPSSRGGGAALENLAYACPHCNDRKWTHVSAADPETGTIVSLFHPRMSPWEEHFEWASVVAGEISGKTPVGRATIACLQLNHPELVGIRRELIKLGVLVISHGT